MGKNLYITTAIPYVNGAPHIGNALDYLIADIWSRYQKQNGREVRFQVGTDEHGNKIAAKAAENNRSPQEYVDGAYVDFENLMKKVGAEYTDFIRTTDGHHKGAVQYIWQQLQPYIYKGSYEGWYCQGHEAFFTDKEVEETDGICQDHQTPYERVNEENYFLKASEFTEQLRDAITKKKMHIVPEFREKEFLELIKDGVKDVSISRPRKNLSWGVEVPGDPEQVMYVWLDALSNYITVLGYPDSPEWKDYWPAEIQVVGKDILRFHAGIWPAILLGLGLPLPKKLLVHGHISSGGSKMSKTVGNVVDPNEVIDTYGLDAFRYFFARHIPTLDDGDFTWTKFENAYNTELANDLGNLVARVSKMILQYQAGVIGESTQAEHDMQLYRDAMERLEFNKALDQVWVNVRSLNRYIDTVKPWEVAGRRETDPEAEPHLSEILGYCAGSLVQIGDLLVPFMPHAAAKILDTFESGVIHEQDGVLFPRIQIHASEEKTTPTAT